MIRKHIKSMNENFMMDNTKVARHGTKEAPTKPATPPNTKPGTRGIPGQRPKPGTQTLPQGENATEISGEIIDLFTQKLSSIKDTPEGREMIENLYNKYANR